MNVGLAPRLIQKTPAGLLRLSAFFIVPIGGLATELVCNLVGKLTGRGVVEE